MKLKLSTLPPFRGAQRLISRLVWGRWLAGFLFWELTGTRRYTPWRTLSETAWDVEEEYPDTVRLLQAFLLGLAIHIRYRTTLKSSVEFAWYRTADFERWVEGATDEARTLGRPRPVGEPQG